MPLRWEREVFFGTFLIINEVCSSVLRSTLSLTVIVGNLLTLMMEIRFAI